MFFKRFWRGFRDLRLTFYMIFTRFDACVRIVRVDSNLIIRDDAFQDLALARNHAFIVDSKNRNSHFCMFAKPTCSSTVIEYIHMKLSVDM